MAAPTVAAPAPASPTLALLASLTPFSQGAEAKVYRHALHGPAHAPLLLKHRFAKAYRAAALDAALARARTAGEARALLRCARRGVRVPGVRVLDAPAGVLGLEWVAGRSVRALLGDDADADGDAVRDDVEDGGDVRDEGEEDALAAYGTTPAAVMRMIGAEVARMHAADVVHGDLTTSNMMLRPAPPGAPELVLIDFGLAFVSGLVEDKAVDLYVLERAFAATHPGAAPLFAAVLAAYAEEAGGAGRAVERRLRDVRLRGRKRSMVG